MPFHYTGYRKRMKRDPCYSITDLAEMYGVNYYEMAKYLHQEGAPQPQPRDLVKTLKPLTTFDLAQAKEYLAKIGVKPKKAI